MRLKIVINKLNGLANFKPARSFRVSVSRSLRSAGDRLNTKVCLSVNGDKNLFTNSVFVTQQFGLSPLIEPLTADGQLHPGKSFDRL